MVNYCFFNTTFSATKTRIFTIPQIMKQKLVLAFTLMSIMQGFAQDAAVKNIPGQEVNFSANEKVVTHRVALGETVVLIAKQYKIKPKDIYEFNPDAVEGISTGMLLKIPIERAKDFKKVALKKENDNYALLNDDSQPATANNTYSASDTGIVPEPEKTQQAVSNSSAKAAKPVSPAPVVPDAAASSDVDDETANLQLSHEVKYGETLSALAVKYNTSVEAIKAANPALQRRELQAGDKLIITKDTEKPEEGTILHKVTYGQTLYSLAEKYHTTVDAITQDNERTLRHGLQSGQKLKIKPGEGYTDENILPEAPETSDTEAATKEAQVTVDSTVKTGQATSNNNEPVTHTVVYGETLFSLAEKYNTTVEAITNENSGKLKNGLQAGQVLKITPDTK